MGENPGAISTGDDWDWDWHREGPGREGGYIVSRVVTYDCIRSLTTLMMREKEEL
jgi:hypothetical protein